MKNRRILTFIALLTGAIFMFPLIVTFTNSFMTENEIAVNYASVLTVFDAVMGKVKSFVSMNVIPREVTLSQYKSVLVYQPTFLILLVNSMKITLPVVIGNVLISLPAAYGFTVWDYKYKERIFLIYIIVMMMPLQAVLVPNYIIADKLNITENYLAIILPGVFSPFGTFLLRQNMKALPKEYFEAAYVDGAGKFKTFLHVVLPQMKSGISALMMLTFIEYWNLVEQAVIFIRDYYKEPLSVYLSRISEGRISLVFAASCIYMFFPLWFLVTGQKDLEKGIELSGVK